jgi:acyl carrier protein
MNIEVKIKEIIAEHLNLQVADINDESGLGITEGWDSVKSLNIVLDIEKNFNIRFDMDDFEDLTSFKNIHKKVSDLLA